jgi:hypothetical protein
MHGQMSAAVAPNKSNQKRLSKESMHLFRQHTWESIAAHASVSREE